MAKEYYYSIEWPKNGGTEKVTIGPCIDQEVALNEALDLASRRGWTPREWWQVWRYGQTNRQGPTWGDFQTAASEPSILSKIGVNNPALKGQA